MIYQTVGRQKGINYSENLIICNRVKIVKSTLRPLCITIDALACETNETATGANRIFIDR